MLKHMLFIAAAAVGTLAFAASAQAAYLSLGTTNTSNAPTTLSGNPAAAELLVKNTNGASANAVGLYVLLTATAPTASAAAVRGLNSSTNGYGLGVVASDFNNDECPDLYITNDFQGDDYLYINNCNGTFTESIAKATGHTSRFSMGVDAADFNNDGRTDIISLDMMPASE